VGSIDVKKLEPQSLKRKIASFLFSQLDLCLKANARGNGTTGPAGPEDGPALKNFDSLIIFP
jgi:hypothetical protein